MIFLPDYCIFGSYETLFFPLVKEILALELGNLDVNVCSVFSLLSKFHDCQSCSETNLERRQKTLQKIYI